MPDESIRNLLHALQESYPGATKPYGSAFESAEEEHGLGWRVEGAPVVFSAITLDGTLSADFYDVQVESLPPGDYLFTGRYSLEELLQLVSRYFRPEAEWPSKR